MKCSIDDCSCSWNRKNRAAILLCRQELIPKKDLGSIKTVPCDVLFENKTAAIAVPSSSIPFPSLQVLRNISYITFRNFVFLKPGIPPRPCRIRNRFTNIGTGFALIDRCCRGRLKSVVFTTFCNRPWFLWWKSRMHATLFESLGFFATTPPLSKIPEMLFTRAW